MDEAEGGEDQLAFKASVAPLACPVIGIGASAGGIDMLKHLLMRILPYRTSDNVISGVVMTFTDITRIQVAEARIEKLTHDLRARVNELETILDLVPVGILILGAEQQGGVLVNKYGARLLGAESQYKGLKTADAAFRFTDEAGNDLTEAEDPIFRAGLRGETITAWQGRLRSSRDSELFVMVSASPLLAEGGGRTGAVAAIVDISEHKRAEAQQLFLMRELQHRVKNILATVTSLANRMARGRGSIEAFSDAFLSRLAALGKRHDLLSRGAWSGASMRVLVTSAIEPFATTGGDVRIEGRDIEMTASATATMGMIFHELVTNAAKYGALSAPGSRLAISWATALGAEEGQLDLAWQESGGPPIDASSPPGFGTGFITRCVGSELCGTARLELVPEGLRCMMSIPLPGNVEAAA